MSGLLIARVIFVIAAVTIPVLHVIVVIVVVIEEVRAFIRSWGTCADTVFSQSGGHLHAISLGFCFGA